MKDFEITERMYQVIIIALFACVILGFFIVAHNFAQSTAHLSSDVDWTNTAQVLEHCARLDK